MSLTKKHRRPYAFLYLLIMVVSAINLQRSANITAAQSTSSNVTLTETATSSETPVPLSSIYPTLTPPPPPRITPTSHPSATQPRVRTAIPTASPTDTPTSTPIVQARPTVVSTGPLLAQEITLATLGRTNLDFLTPDKIRKLLGDRGGDSQIAKEITVKPDAEGMNVTLTGLTEAALNFLSPLTTVKIENNSMTVRPSVLTEWATSFVNGSSAAKKSN